MFRLLNGKESFAIFSLFLHHGKVERPQPVKQAIKHASQARGPCQHPLKRDAQVCCLYILHMRYQFVDSAPEVISLGRNYGYYHARVSSYTVDPQFEDKNTR